MASKNIKGITIEFDGDTTKLGRALSDINKQSKGVDQSLKAVNKSLKFNPKNTELIAQKQTLLKQKIQQTKQQLDAFKAAQDRMDAQGVDKNSQEYMELRRNIIETESKLKHFNDELEKTKRIKFDQVGQQFKDVGDKMQAVGKGLTTHVTGPILAVGAAAVKSFNEVQEGLNIVAQKTGATGKALADMQESVRNLAKEIPTDFETAGTAIGEVNTRFHVTGQELETLAGQFVKFAKVNNTDVNTSIDQVQKSLAAFGLSAKQAPALLDAMTRAGQNTGVSMETLQSGLVQNAAALQELGLNIGQSVNFMAQLETSGANSETVMQGLRKALKNATADGIPLNQALEDLQNTIVNGKDGMDGLTAAYDLFGKSGDQIYNAVKNGTINFAELSKSATDSKGALDAVFEQTLTPADKFKTTMNTLKDTGYQLGNNLMTILAPVLEKLAAGAEKLSNWWQSLDKDTQDLIIKAALVAAAVGPILIVIGKIASGIGSLISLLPMLASPAGLVVAAIAAIVAIGVALYKNWDKIKAKAAELKQWIVDKWTALKESVSKIWNGIKSGIMKVWNGLKEGASTVWGNIKSSVSNAAEGVSASIKSKWSTLKDFASKTWQFIGGVMTHPIESAKILIKKIIDKIKGFFKFDFELPKIKLPHFKIKPAGWRFRDLLKGDIPKLSIEWYKQGGIFDSPSVIGVGEAGPEAVLPIEKLNTMLNNMADSIVNGILIGQGMTAQAGDITIPIYLYPSGAKMGEETVKMYDIYKKQLG